LGSKEFGLHLHAVDSAEQAKQESESSLEPRQAVARRGASSATNCAPRPLALPRHPSSTSSRDYVFFFKAGFNMKSRAVAASPPSSPSLSTAKEHLVDSKTARSAPPHPPTQANFNNLLPRGCSVTRVERHREGELVKIAASARSHWACRKFVGLVLCPLLADVSTNAVACCARRSRRV
jgi:hypothetical protein